MYLHLILFNILTKLNNKQQDIFFLGKIYVFSVFVYFNKIRFIYFYYYIDSKYNNVIIK